jgi:hypothetical protein
MKSLSEPPKTDSLSRSIRVQFVALLGLVFLGGMRADARLLIASAFTSVLWGLFIIHGRSRGWWEPASEVKKEDEKEDEKPSE